MKKCTFLIVTPVLNGVNFIADCINSVQEAFREFSYCHVIVDGGSRDNTKFLVEKNNDDCQQFVEMPGASMYEAINKGINIAEAEYFYQLNADDIILPGTPELVYKYFKENDKFDVISGGIISVDIETNLCKIKVPLRNQFSINKIGLNLYVNQPSSFIKYESIKKIGQFSEDFKYASDTDLWLKLIKQGYQFIKTDRLLSVNRVHSSCAALSQQHINELSIVRKTYYQTSIMSTLVKLHNSILFLLKQVYAIVIIKKLLPKNIICYGNIFTRIRGVFFTTTAAGIKFGYPFFKGNFGFKGRIY